MRFKLYLVLLLLLTYCISWAEDEEGENPFRRLYEMAHPTPVEKLPSMPWILEEKPNSSPIFLNVKTTVDDIAYPLSVENESSIAVNPTNPQNIIASAVDYRDDSSTWVYVSSDGGKTFRSINLGKTHDFWASSNDPSVAFSSDGTAYLVYGSFPAGGAGKNGVYISISKDGGKNWQKHIPVIEHAETQTPDSAFEDKYYITVDNSPTSPYFHDLYIPWKRVTARDSATEIVIAKSTDGGLHWSTPIRVSDRLSGTSEDTTFGQSFPYCVTGPAGEVYLFWNHGIKHGVGFSRSTDGGATWTPPKIAANYPIFGKTTKISEGFRHTVKGVVRAESYPSAACDITEGKYRGNLYLTYAGGNYPNIYFIRSTDGGDTWSDPVFVHSDTTRDQFWQWLAIDRTTGDLGVMYFDSRDDANNLLVNCYVSYSSDAGNTWIDRRAADVSSDLRLNPFGGNAFAGDYSGCAFHDGVIYPSWVDMRNSIQNINNSDVFTAIIDINAPKPPYNFYTKPIADQIGNLIIHWNADAETTFGSPVNPDDIDLVLERDGSVIGNFKVGDTTFTDTGLTPFKPYNYSIFAKYKGKYSLTRYTSGVPGGADKPQKPEIFVIDSTNSGSFMLGIKLPALRADDSTAITQLSSIRIFSNGLEIFKGDLSSSDTGTTKQITLNLPQDGFYRLSASVHEQFKNPNIETAGDTCDQMIVYAGNLKGQLSDDFSSANLPYLVSDNWKLRNIIYATSPTSIGNADASGYKSLQNDTLTIVPFDIKGWEAIRIRFNNACFVHPSDTARVEFSYEGSGVWNTLASYNSNDFTPWKDANLNTESFRYEDMTIPLLGQNHQIMYFRFRFNSNSFFNSKGWFIDDLLITPTVVDVTEANNKEQVLIYPNPAKNFVNMKLNNIAGIDNQIIITNVIGEKLLEIEAEKNCSADISELSKGMYFIWLEKNGRLQPLGKFIKSL